MRKLILLFFLVSLARSQDSTAIMYFGDSITELDWEGGYRSFLWHSLDSAGYVVNAVGSRVTNHDDGSLGWTFPASQWEHEGVTSRTAGTWLSTVVSVVTANPSKVMVMQIGTNDASNGSKSSVTIRDTISKLMDSVWSVSDTTRIVFSNIPRMVAGTLFNQAVLDTIDAVNLLLPALVAEKVALGRYIVMVDQYSALTESGDFTGDGVHPSVTGYHKMRTAYLPYVIQAIDSTVTVPSSDKYLMWTR